MGPERSSGGVAGDESIGARGFQSVFSTWKKFARNPFRKIPLEITATNVAKIIFKREFESILGDERAAIRADQAGIDADVDGRDAPASSRHWGRQSFKSKTTGKIPWKIEYWRFIYIE